MPRATAALGGVWVLTMAGFLQSLLDDYHAQIERHRNRPFLDAAMAACALAACTDGEVSFSERIRVDQILQTLERLKVFDPHEGVDLFNKYTDLIFEHPATGHETAFLAVEKIGRDPAEIEVSTMTRQLDLETVKEFRELGVTRMVTAPPGFDPEGLRWLLVHQSHRAR